MNGRYVERGGVLVPADAVVELETTAAPVVELREEPTPVEPARVGRGRRREVSADELRERLAARRAVTDVERDDEQERREADAAHRMALAAIEERKAADERDRRERETDAREEAALNALYRKAAKSGERARIRADIDRSAEMRALRVASVRKGALWVGLPVLGGFAAWSTAGVQAGMAKLLDLDHGSAGWWLAWIVEPLLIAIVAGLIIVRAVLRSSGGDTDRRADIAEAVALGTSIALNLAGGWTGQGGWATAAGEALGHSVGAVGAAGTAWLIGVVIDYVSKAKPWKDAPRLADLDVLPGGRPEAINRGKRASEDTDADDLPDDIRALVADVRAAIGAGTLPADPTAYAIHRRVMGGRGDKGKASRVAPLVAGWRPAPTGGGRVNGRRPELVGGRS